MLHNGIEQICVNEEGRLPEEVSETAAASGVERRPFPDGSRPPGVGSMGPFVVEEHKTKFGIIISCRKETMCASKNSIP